MQADERRIRDRVWQAAQRLIVLAVFLVAVALLGRELRHYNLREVIQSLERITASRLWFAVGLTVVNYMILIGYDWLAIRSVGHPLPLRKIALASFTGHAVSYNFGALLGGTTVRYRLYSAWGLSTIEIVKLVTMLGVIFWVGALFLAGMVFVLQPLPIPEELHLPLEHVRPLGWVLLLIVASWLGLTLFRRRPLVIREQAFVLPTFRTSLWQMAIASADLAVAAGVLYVLMPGDLPLAYWEFLGAYLLGVVAVLFTHVPGGLGVFELVLLKLVAPESEGAPGDSEGVLAGLLVFRVIYYLIPLLVASILLAVNELRLRTAPLRPVRPSVPHSPS